MLCTGTDQSSQRPCSRASRSASHCRTIIALQPKMLTSSGSRGRSTRTCRLAGDTLAERLGANPGAGRIPTALAASTASGRQWTPAGTGGNQRSARQIYPSAAKGGTPGVGQPPPRECAADCDGRKPAFEIVKATEELDLGRRLALVEIVEGRRRVDSSAVRDRRNPSS